MDLRLLFLGVRSSRIVTAFYAVSKFIAKAFMSRHRLVFECAIQRRPVR